MAVVLGQHKEVLNKALFCSSLCSSLLSACGLSCTYPLHGFSAWIVHASGITQPRVTVKAKPIAYRWEIGLNTEKSPSSIKLFSNVKSMTDYKQKKVLLTVTILIIYGYMFYGLSKRTIWKFRSGYQEDVLSCVSDSLTMWWW